MCGGGGGPSGTTKYEWNDDMRNRMNIGLNRAENFAARPFQRFDRGMRLADGSMSAPGERVAPLSRGQQGAIANSNWFMENAASPLDSMNAASGQIQDTLGGKYLGANPAAQGPEAQFNPWTDRFRNNYLGANQYGGMDSPYYKQMQQNVASEMADAYKQGTSADTTRMFNLAGAFGGSAHQNAVANNEGAFAKQLGNTLAGMNADQYTRSAGLEEGRIGRGFQSDESLLSRGNQNWQSALDRQYQGHEGERGRQVGLVGAGQNEQGMAIDRGNWAAQMGALMQGQNQRLMDQGYGDWADEMNYDRNMSDWLFNTYGRAMGGGAGTQQSIYGGRGSNASSAIGGLLAAYGLLG